MTNCKSTLTKKKQYRACRLKKSAPGERGRLVERAGPNRHISYDNQEKQYTVSRVGKDGFVVATAYLGKNLERARKAAPVVYLRAGMLYHYTDI